MKAKSFHLSRKNVLGPTSLLVVCVARNQQESTMVKILPSSTTMNESLSYEHDVYSLFLKVLLSAKAAKDSSGDGWCTGTWQDW